MTNRLENWRVVHASHNDAFLPPELSGIALVGRVFGHPRFQDGREIETSAIAAVAGRIITTRSGSRYELGEPEPGYAEWCKQRGRVIDPERPIRVVEESRG
jgi:hypothetical protein